MKIAIIGASGKTGQKLVDGALARGHRVVAVCRDASVGKLEAYSGHDDVEIFTSDVISREPFLLGALQGCDGVAAILLSVRKLKSTDLVASLEKAAEVHGIKRFVFTAGEVTAEPTAGETFTRRQRFMKALGLAISWVTPFSVGDMINASALVQSHEDWDWSIVRAPTLHDAAPVGYRFCALNDIDSQDAISREDYAACMLDILDGKVVQRGMLSIISDVSN